MERAVYQRLYQAKEIGNERSNVKYRTDNFESRAGENFCTLSLEK